MGSTNTCAPFQVECEVDACFGHNCGRFSCPVRTLFSPSLTVHVEDSLKLREGGDTAVIDIKVGCFNLLIYISSVTVIDIMQIQSYSQKVQCLRIDQKLVGHGGVG